MPYIIATYRPFEWLNPISWINSISRQKKRAPYDHVAFYKFGYIYESVIGDGVHKLLYDDWIKGREGTHLFMYAVPDDYLDLRVFNRLEGRKYDIWSNGFQLFGLVKLLSFKSKNKINCSELLANMLLVSYPERYTPRMIVEIMDKNKFKLKHIII